MHELGSHFGLHGERVDDPAKLKGALQTALKKVQDGTTAILNVDGEPLKRYGAGSGGVP